MSRTIEVTLERADPKEDEAYHRSIQDVSSSRTRDLSILVAQCIEDSEISSLATQDIM